MFGDRARRRTGGEAVLLRVVVHFYGDKVVLLLGGYDKGADPKSRRQEREIFGQAYDIAMQVIELREKHGLTQAELAKRCGVDQADISHIERGATSPTTRTLQRIAEALDADVRLVARAS
jgi:DNA-binding XRE family transcriptional regulator